MLPKWRQEVIQRVEGLEKILTKKDQIFTAFYLLKFNRANIVKKQHAKLAVVFMNEILAKISFNLLKSYFGDIKFEYGIDLKENFKAKLEKRSSIYSIHHDSPSKLSRWSKEKEFKLMALASQVSTNKMQPNQNKKRSPNVLTERSTSNLNYNGEHMNSQQSFNELVDFEKTNLFQFENLEILKTVKSAQDQNLKGLKNNRNSDNYKKNDNYLESRSHIEEDNEIEKNKYKKGIFITQKILTPQPNIYKYSSEIFKESSELKNSYSHIDVRSPLKVIDHERSRLDSKSDRNIKEIAKNPSSRAISIKNDNNDKTKTNWKGVSEKSIKLNSNVDIELMKKDPKINQFLNPRKTIKKSKNDPNLPKQVTIEKVESTPQIIVASSNSLNQKNKESQNKLGKEAAKTNNQIQSKLPEKPPKSNNTPKSNLSNTKGSKATKISTGGENKDKGKNNSTPNNNSSSNSHNTNNIKTPKEAKTAAVKDESLKVSEETEPLHVNYTNSQTIANNFTCAPNGKNLHKDSSSVVYSGKSISTDKKQSGKDIQGGKSTKVDYNGIITIKTPNFGPSIKGQVHPLNLVYKH